MPSEVSATTNSLVTTRLTILKPVRRPPLPRGALCAVLFSHGVKQYHWSFIYPTSAEDATKFHAVTGAESWLYQRDEHFVARSKHACVVVQLSMSPIKLCDVHWFSLQTHPICAPRKNSTTFSKKYHSRARPEQTSHLRVEFGSKLPLQSYMI